MGNYNEQPDFVAVISNLQQRISNLERGVQRPLASVSVSGQSQPGGAVNLSFSTVTLDRGGFFDTLGDRTKLMIPGSMSGVFLATSTVLFNLAVSAGDVSAGIRKNGSIPFGIDGEFFHSPRGGEVAYQGVASAFMPLVAGDYLQVRTVQTSGSAGTVSGTLSVTRVG